MIIDQPYDEEDEEDDDDLPDGTWSESENGDEDDQAAHNESGDDELNGSIVEVHNEPDTSLSGEDLPNLNESAQSNDEVNLDQMQILEGDADEIIVLKLTRIGEFFEDYTHRFVFPGLDGQQRKLVHKKCDELGVFHWTKRSNRTVCVSNRDEDKEVFEQHKRGDTIQAQMRDKIESLTAELAAAQLANPAARLAAAKPVRSLELAQNSFRPLRQRLFKQLRPWRRF